MSDQPININVRLSDPVSTPLSKQMLTMTRSTLDGILRQASVRAIGEAGLCLSTTERPAPWCMRWLPPARRWWDRRERRRADFQRTVHIAACDAFQRVAVGAKLAIDTMDRVNQGPQE